MMARRAKEAEVMGDRMTKAVMILGILIVWAFILTQNARGQAAGIRWEPGRLSSSGRAVCQMAPTQGSKGQAIEKGGEIVKKTHHE